MQPSRETDLRHTRRAFLGHSALGLGAVALWSLLNKDGRTARAAAPENVRGLDGLPNFPPRVCRVIFLYMSGGPSHVDLFDPKERLDRENGNPLPF